MKKNTIITIIAVLGIAAALFFILQHNKNKNQQEVAVVAQKNTDVAVRTATVQNQSMNGEFVVNGTFLPNRQAQISAEIGGQLVALYVQEGSYVRAGQSIGRIGGEKIDVNITSARANLEMAEQSLRRYEMAYKTGGVTAMQLDQARLQVKTARAQLKGTQLQSGDTNIVSKVSGIVNKKMVEVGAVVGAGTPLIEIVDISAVKLKVDVDQAMMKDISMGQIVKVKPDIIDGTVDGRITFIAPSASGAMKFPVEITVSNSNNTLKAGMYGSAYFNKMGSNQVLSIPREAFVGSVSDNQVFVLKDGKAVLTKIQSGVNYGDKVEVLSGLQPGDEVITSGQINLQNNSKVRVLK